MPPRAPTQAEGLPTYDVRGLERAAQKHAGAHRVRFRSHHTRSRPTVFFVSEVVMLGRTAAFLGITQRSGVQLNSAPGVSYRGTYSPAQHPASASATATWSSNYLRNADLRHCCKDREIYLRGLSQTNFEDGTEKLEYFRPNIRGSVYRVGLRALQHEVCARCRLIRFADMLTVLHGSLLSSYCGIAGFAMVLYEYIVTLGDEVDLFWKRKISSASIIFFLNRYLTILGYVLDSGTFHVQTDIMFVPAQRAPRRSTRLILVLAVTIISRSSAIGADFLVVMVTWWKTRKSMKLYKEANIQTSYGSLMLRDGTVYFLVLLILNVLHMVLTLLAYTEAFIAVSYVSIFTDPMMSILVSRFLLDLRQVDHTGANAISSELPSFVAPQNGAISEYASFVSPFGAQPELARSGDVQIDTTSEGIEGDVNSGESDSNRGLDEDTPTSSHAHLRDGDEALWRTRWDASGSISTSSSVTTYITAHTGEALSTA
ncbi:hypothetical protein ONZ51_g9821 [Trametes cubensis]|uniref:DUF6533 domain-containing protein n=1 Tax=Trametes cubensis TaxID=1111947 RepID=A0AAD7TKK6_9APHY|nr:hypothetical protein ONZ51_g9821 [Trametes cubensis]